MNRDIDDAYKRTVRRSIDNGDIRSKIPLDTRYLRFMATYSEETADRLYMRKVILNASKKLGKLDQIKLEDTNIKFTIDAVSLDITDINGFKSIVEKTIDCFSPADLYFHNGVRYIALSVASMLTFIGGKYHFISEPDDSDDLNSNISTARKRFFCLF